MVRINNSSASHVRLRGRTRLSLPWTILLVLLGLSCLFVATLMASLDSLHDPTSLGIQLLEPISQRGTESVKKAPVVGYAVSVAGCGSDPITEGAAVLKHSIHLASNKNPGGGGRYGYQMYAIFHPDAESCATPLADMGYTLVRRPTPVAVSDIKGKFLREHIEKNGCCGEKELVKLEAYTLVQHSIVVHLDLDTLILKPLNVLFDAMMSHNATTIDPVKVGAMWGDMPLPSRVDAFFTKDYPMVLPQTKYKPA